MRPQIALILIGLLGVVVLAMVIGRVLSSGPNSAVVAPVVSDTPPSDTPSVNVASPADKNTVIASTREKERMEVLEKNLDEIRLHFANQEPEPILDMLTNSEPEVRSEAVQALKHLDYTNAVPSLKMAMNTTDNLREKAAIMDAIEFLQTPESDTNAEADILKVIQAHKKAGTNATSGSTPKK